MDSFEQILMKTLVVQNLTYGDHVKRFITMQ